MSKSLYLTATEEKSGKSAIVLGMVQLLSRKVEKIAIFRPIINTPLEDNTRDHDINLVLSHFSLDLPYEDTFAFTMAEARQLISKGQKDVLLDTILAKFKKLDEKYDFILCEGTDFSGKDGPFEFELNTDIADILGCPMLTVTNGQSKTAQEIINEVQGTAAILTNRTINVVSCIVNRSPLSTDEALHVTKSLSETSQFTTFLIPEEPSLGKPTMADVQKWLKADIIHGKTLSTLVDGYLIAAMNAGNFLAHLEEGHVVITPGDREDIVLASLASLVSSSSPNPAGIVLTGGLDLAPSVLKLINGWEGVGVPILSVKDNTIRCIDILYRLYGRIEADDTRKIETAIGQFDKYINSAKLTTILVGDAPKKVSPKMFEYTLLERASRHKMRIVLPEGAEERILRATESLIRRNVAEIILLGNAKEIAQKISALNLHIKTTIIQPEEHPKFTAYSEKYFELRKAKGISLEQAKDIMRDPTYFGTMMVHMDDADGMVSGAINTTAHTIRPSFEFIKTKPGTSIVSSVFLMCMKDKVLVFGDCAVNPNPNPEQLANIAISSAQTAKVFGIEPRIAMLSYSTGASGKGADVESVIEATKLAQKMAPELAIEGPLQYDAAIDADVAKTKLPDSAVAGRATVFIFPDLNTGNNTYKAVQRAANAVAIGPVLQGLNKPVNDLSRGCTVADIVNTVAITAVQAQSEKGL